MSLAIMAIVPISTSEPVVTLCYSSPGFTTLWNINWHFIAEETQRRII